MPQLDISKIDVRVFQEHFDEVYLSVCTFLEHVELPSTKSTLYSYLNFCDRHELSLAILKKDIALAQVEIDKDVRTVSRNVSDQGKRSRLWESKIDIDMDPTVSSLQRDSDFLGKLISSLEELKWIIKSKRENARNYVSYVHAEV